MKLSLKPITFAILPLLVLASCGGSLSDYDILKSEAEASGQAVFVATYDDKEVMFAVGDEYSEDEQLYIALSYESSVMGAYRIDPLYVFFPEAEEGLVTTATVSFTYEASLDLEAGTASDISNITSTEGTAEANDIAYAQGFLNAAADGVKTFINGYQFAEQRGEQWVIDKLEDMGYVLNTYDEESHNYMEGQIQQQYGLTVQIKKLYQGYINQDERWVQVVVFENEQQAAQYFYKRWNAERGNDYSYHYRTRNVFVFTGSYDTYVEVSSGT